MNPYITVIRTFWLALFSLTACCSVAEQVDHRLTLRDAIEIVEKENLKIILNREVVKQYLYSARQEGGELLPQLSATASQRRDATFFTPLGTPISSISNSFDARISASVPILDWDKIASYRSAQKGYHVSREEHKKIVQDILREMILLYIRLVNDRNSLGVLEAAITRDSLELDKTKVRFEVGEASLLDVTRQEVQVARNQKLLSRQKIRVAGNHANLKAFLNIDQNYHLILDSLAETPLVLPPKHTDSIELAKQKRPDFIALDKSIDKAKFDHRAVCWEYLPSVSGTAHIGQGSSVIFDNKHENIWGFGLSVELPLFEGFQSINKSLEKKAAIREKLYEKDDQEKTLLADIERSEVELQARYDEVIIAQKEIKLANKELELAQIQFYEGTADNQEVVRAQANLVSVSDDYAIAKGLLGQAIIEWARIRGDVKDCLEYLQP